MNGNINAHGSNNNSASSADTFIDMRKNLFILSVPSAAGKNTVYNAVKELLPITVKIIIL